MAKINRVRIINFYYNNNIRQIADETFNFYGGENALINLANGGGKSVLIQLMLQPIVPDQSVQKREMSSFFKYSTHPAYVLLEWILDNPDEKDYVMTGIAIAPKVIDDDTSMKLNYFTFCSHYSSPCDFDLTHNPFVTTAEGNYIITPFEKAREAVKAIAGKNSGVTYFNKDDNNSYKKQLSDYGISQEEWKNIIAKINNEEGGIDQLFAKCATSGKLMDEWIIKTVDKALLDTGDGNAQIQDLMEHLVDNAVKNDDYIRNQKVLSRYFEDHLVLVEALEKVSQRMDEYNLADCNLNRLYSLLKMELSRYEADLNDQQYQKEELEEKKIQILKEEKSEFYYACLDSYEEYSSREKEIINGIQQLQEHIQDAENFISIQKAVKIFKKLQMVKGDIDSLDLKLREMQGISSDSDTRLKNVKYTLKTLYKKIVDDCSVRQATLVKQLKELEAKVSQMDYASAANQRELNDVSSKLAISKHKLAEDNAFQKKAEKALKLTFNRGMQGRLVDNEISKIKKELAALSQDALNRLADLQCRMNDNETIFFTDLSLKENLIKEIIEIEFNKKDVDKKIEDYREKESGLRRVILKYDLPENNFFSINELCREIDSLVRNRESRLFTLELKLYQINEVIEITAQDQIFFPKALSELLDASNVHYQTGEAYLSSLTEPERMLLLSKNTILPFGIIVDPADIDKIRKLKFEDTFLRQIIPVFPADNLNPDYVPKPENELNFISWYKPDLFNKEERKKYILQLEHDKAMYEQHIAGLKKELSSLREDRLIVLSFQFDKEYFGQLAQDQKRLSDLLTEKESEKCNVDDRLSFSVKEQKEIDSSIELLKKDHDQLRQNQLLLDELIERDSSFAENLGTFIKLQEREQSLQRQIETDLKNMKKLNDEHKAFQAELFDIENEMNAGRKNYSRFEFVEVGEPAEGTVDSLEKEYQNLSFTDSQSVSETEKLLSDKKLLFDEYQSDLNELNIPYEDYIDASYKEQELSIIKGRLSVFNAENIDLNNKRLVIHDNVVKSKTQLETAVKHLGDLGIARPLPKEDLQQNYPNRLKAIDNDKQKIEKIITAIQNKSTLCRSRIGIIEHLIVPNITKSVKASFALQEDIEKQCDSYETDYVERKNVYEEEKNKFIHLFHEMAARYKGVHKCITDILNSMSSLDFGKYTTNEDILSHINELKIKKESLEKLLDFYRQQLSTMEDTKRQVVDQCLSYASMIHEGIKEISEKSKIRLTNKNVPIHMLRIDMPSEIDSEARKRMTDYIESALTLMSSNVKNQTIDKKVYKERINSTISARLLLNQLTGRDHFPVFIYKIEINDSHSGMKPWENAMKENSGGEKFVCFFTVVSALMAYTREISCRKLNVGSMGSSKVLMLDNPFGKTSSEHLLKAVMDIARTLNIQLICLSDLNQSSITNRFNLIYNLSVRKKMYSEKETLYIETVMNNKESERLEHVALYQTTN